MWREVGRRRRHESMVCGLGGGLDLVGLCGKKLMCVWVFGCRQHVHEVWWLRRHHTLVRWVLLVRECGCVSVEVLLVPSGVDRS